MKNEKSNYLLNAVLFLATTLVVVTSFIVDNKAPFILGLARSSWLSLHIVFGLSMSVLVAVHLVRHLSWIKVILARKIMNRNLWINTCSLFIFSAMLFSGLIMWLTKSNVVVIGISFGGLRDLHGQTSVFLFILMVTHLFMHRRWIASSIK